MARVLVTGSADGLGVMSAELLAKQGHQVTLHARTEERGAAAKKRVPAAEHVLVADVSTLAAMRGLAEQANATGAYDAVIHNVGIGYQEPQRVETVDGLERQFAINVVAPYVLTALMKRPKRLVYLSSGMHKGGSPDLRDAQWAERRWAGSQAYSDTKLFDLVLAYAVAARWPDVLSTAVEPGWVATKMGGRGAPDDLAAGAVTQAWLAVSEDPAAKVTAKYFYHQKERETHPAARDPKVQDALIAYLETVSKVSLPAQL
jgi:NAD(P)-dependent dehydrogenase (short-subunit alcohol dehydrogenase family)